MIVAEVGVGLLIYYANHLYGIPSLPLGEQKSFGASSFSCLGIWLLVRLP